MVTEQTRSGTKPRLCFVVTSHVSATTFLKGYLRFLGRNWDVVLICAPHPALATLALEEGITLHALPMARNPSPVKDLISLMSLIRLLSRIEPDVVVYATPKASLLTSIAAWLTRVPARVYELWGLRLETSQGISYRIFWAMERLTMALSTRVVANSRSLAERAIGLRLTRDRPVDVLGAGSSHGVDIDWFASGADLPAVDEETAMLLKPSANTFTVGFVGRLHPDKGIDVLLSALARCADRGVTVQGLLVGAAEGARLAGQIESLRDRVKVRIVGEVRDVRPYIEAMDVLVLMSRREGFPNVVLEAAAMQTPAIVANSTGTVDSVVDGVTGWVVPVDDTKALANCLLDLETDREKIRRAGVSARAWVEREFRREVIWSLHEEYFAAALLPQSRNRRRK
jgi:glycosyltransferase involved in cell wall biosynthesis